MQTYLITGANRGIGLELCRQLLARGDHVIAASRNPQAQALAALQVADADAIELVALDVTQPHSIAAAKQAIGDRPIDVLINNAGIMGPERQTALDVDFDGFARTLDVNTLAPLRVAQTFLPNLRKARGAKVFTVSSAMGSLADGGADHIAYRTSKAAVNKVMQALASELKADGIVVGMLHPGWVRTDMGGANAALEVSHSVAGILNVIDGWGLEKSGAFFDYAGHAVAW